MVNRLGLGKLFVKCHNGRKVLARTALAMALIKVSHKGLK